MEQNRKLKSCRIDALPVVNSYIDECGLPEIFERFIPAVHGKRVADSKILLFLLRNIMLSGFPLYKLAEWSADYVPELLGLAGHAPDAINDDRVGRALDELFLADRASMLTTTALRAIDKYRLDTAFCHNDSTTVTFHGSYRRKPKFDKLPVCLRRGFNKDHRPDLKQLIFNLVVCADGAVPVHFKLHDGNVSDDVTHQETWDSLRALIGNSDFVYVADSKLCASDNMNHIARRGGKFITVMPRTRKEHGQFIEWVKENPVRGQALWHRDPLSGNPGNSDHYHGYESVRFVSAEGYRIIWIHSSQKQKTDAQTRKERIRKTFRCLRELGDGLNKYSLKTRKAIGVRTEKILGEYNTRDFFTWRITAAHKRMKKKKTRGRPGTNTAYTHVRKTIFHLEWSVNEDSLKKAANADGFFPLITNIGGFDMKKILRHYKYQPNLEKRHAYLKSVLDVAPVHLKTPERIEALLFLYYLALMIYALIERDIRAAMKTAGVQSIPIYPENRECRKPSAEKILESLQKFSKHELWEDGNLEEIFFDSLSNLQKDILKLLKIPLTHYQIN